MHLGTNEKPVVLSEIHCNNQLHVRVKHAFK